MQLVGEGQGLCWAPRVKHGFWPASLHAVCENSHVIFLERQFSDEFGSLLWTLHLLHISNTTDTKLMVFNVISRFKDFTASVHLKLFMSFLIS